MLDFYPRFGFVSVDQYQNSKAISVENTEAKVEKLDMSDQEVGDLVYRTIGKSLAVSKLQMYDNESLNMFYLTSFMSDFVYYIKALNTIAVAEYEADTLYLYDVFSTKAVPLDKVIKAMGNKETKKVVFSFTPKEPIKYDVSLLKEEDTTLFVMGYVNIVRMEAKSIAFYHSPPGHKQNEGRCHS